LSGTEVIAAYGLRFKIEVTFRTLIHLLGGFAYRFWLKALKTAPTWPANLNKRRLSRVRSSPNPG